MLELKSISLREIRQQNNQRQVISKLYCILRTTLVLKVDTRKVGKSGLRLKLWWVTAPATGESWKAGSGRGSDPLSTLAKSDPLPTREGSWEGKAWKKDCYPLCTGDYAFTLSTCNLVSWSYLCFRIHPFLLQCHDLGTSFSRHFGPNLQLDKLYVYDLLLYVYM